MRCVRKAKWSDENNEKEGEVCFIENDESEKQKQKIETKLTSFWYKKDQFN